VTKANAPFSAVLFVVLILVTYAPSIPLALVGRFHRWQNDEHQRARLWARQRA